MLNLKTLNIDIVHAAHKVEVSIYNPATKNKEGMYLDVGQLRALRDSINETIEKFEPVHSTNVVHIKEKADQ